MNNMFIGGGAFVSASERRHSFSKRNKQLRDAPVLKYERTCAILLEGALAALRDCRYVSLSGAGPTTYAIFTDDVTASAAAQRLRGEHPDWWIVATTLGN